MKIYDLAIIGMGLAGATAAAVASEEGLNVLALEKGQGPKSRKSLSSGWLGRAFHTLSRIDCGFGIVTDEKAKTVAAELCRKANGGLLEYCHTADLPCDFPLHPIPGSYCKTNATCGRNLSQELYSRIAGSGKTDLLFGTEVERVDYTDHFILYTNRGKMEAYKCLIATGGTTTEWLSKTFTSFSIPIVKTKAAIGVRVEVSSKAIKPFLQVVGDIRLSVGAAFLDDARQNSLVGECEEDGLVFAFPYSSNRQTERTNFMVGVELDSTEAIRIIKIINILTNNKIRHERAIDFVNKCGLLEHFDQFDPARYALKELSRMVPQLLNLAIVHVPEIRIGGSLLVDGQMKTVFPKLYGAGECVFGIASPFAAIASAMVAIKTMEDKYV